jgi:hypothetical protein
MQCLRGTSACLRGAGRTAKEGRDPALDRRRAREGIEQVATFGALADLYLLRRAEKGKCGPKPSKWKHRRLSLFAARLVTGS